MKATLLGVSEVKFTDNNGRAVQGVSMHTAFADPNVEGQRVERFFVNDNIHLPDNIKLGCELDLTFNYRGKLEAVSIA